MTRTLFFFTALVGMLVAMTAVLIRIEHYAPGVTALFQDANGEPDIYKFADVAMLHEGFAYLCVMLLGTTMMSAARDKGASFGRLFVALGLIICAATLVYIGLSALPVLPQFGEGVGWVLYPPVSNPSYLDQLAFADVISERVLVMLPKLLLLPAAAALFLGAYMMVSTQTGWRLLGAGGFVMVILFCLIFVGQWGDLDVLAMAMVHVLIALPLLACMSIRLIDDAIPWLLMLTLGFLVAMFTFVPTLFVISSTFQTYRETLFDAATLYAFPLGLAWYALPALMMYTHKTRLGAGGVLGVFGAITFGLVLWIVPLFQLGTQGQVRGLIDYPNAFAQQNATATAGVAIFILIYLACIIIVRRNRLPNEA